MYAILPQDYGERWSGHRCWCLRDPISLYASGCKRTADWPLPSGRGCAWMLNSVLLKTLRRRLAAPGLVVQKPWAPLRQHNGTTWTSASMAERIEAAEAEPGDRLGEPSGETMPCTSPSLSRHIQLMAHRSEAMPVLSACRPEDQAR
jgi:hypothetical protein